MKSSWLVVRVCKSRCVMRCECCDAIVCIPWRPSFRLFWLSLVLVNPPFLSDFLLSPCLSFLYTPSPSINISSFSSRRGYAFRCSFLLSFLTLLLLLLPYVVYFPCCCCIPTTIHTIEIIAFPCVLHLAAGKIRQMRSPFSSSSFLLLLIPLHLSFIVYLKPCLTSSVVTTTNDLQYIYILKKKTLWLSQLADGATTTIGRMLQ